MWFAAVLQMVKKNSYYPDVWLLVLLLLLILLQFGDPLYLTVFFVGGGGGGCLSTAQSIAITCIVSLFIYLSTKLPYSSCMT